MFKISWNSDAKYARSARRNLLQPENTYNALRSLVDRAVLGGVSYGDFVVDGDHLSVMTEHDLAYGIQTSVDLAPESWEHWAFNLGAKYLNTTAAFAGTPGEVNVDPLIWRAMLVYRW